MKGKRKDQEDKGSHLGISRICLQALETIPLKDKHILANYLTVDIIIENGNLLPIQEVR